MKRSLFPYLIVTLAAAIMPLSAVETAPVFTDHMILQRETPVRVWGSGQPGENISVDFKGKTASTTVSKEGEWLVELPAFSASSEGATLSISGSNKLIFEDVVVGDIWLCAGQSNMAYSLKGITDAEKFISEANNSAIRLFKVPNVWSRTPQNTLKAKWQVSTSDSARGFSAVGYIVGLDIQKAVDVPVGLIQIAWGGCRIEAMTSADAFSQIPGLQSTATNVEQQVTEMQTKTDDQLRKDRQRIPTVLYNGMAHPLTPFAVKGMIWYQGEDNHSEGAIYTEKLKALALSWRQGFQNPDMPVYVVQLPPFMYGQEDPSKLPNFRVAQQRFAVNDPYAGFITSSDCGNPDDIHPKNKGPLAERLANLVLYDTYGIGQDDAVPPQFLKATPEKGSIIIDFLYPNGLTTRDSLPPSHLEVAGEDGVYHSAVGVIEGDKLIVSSEEVPAPVRVRFAWHKIADPNLVNRAGVPVAPFNSQVPVR